MELVSRLSWLSLEAIESSEFSLTSNPQVLIKAPAVSNEASSAFSGLIVCAVVWPAFKLLLKTNRPNGNRDEYWFRRNLRTIKDISWGQRRIVGCDSRGLGSKIVKKLNLLFLKTDAKLKSLFKVL